MNAPELKFIVDENVGKLARWLRMLGFDAKFFNGNSDSEMVEIALKEDRILLTRDTRIPKRRVAFSGELKIILFKTEILNEQIKQLTWELDVIKHSKPFTRCMECNELLVERTKEEVKIRVPPYVYQTQHRFLECPRCRRIYWKGTHWQNMNHKIHGKI